MVYKPLRRILQIGQCVLQIKANYDINCFGQRERICISKKNRQNKKFKRTNNDLQNIHIKLMIE